MLGEMLVDTLGIEGPASSVSGLGFISMHTELRPEKQLHRRTGMIIPFDVPVTGYEIHAGVSTGSGLDRPLIRFNPERYGIDENSLDGVLSDDGNIMGTYLHGLFDLPDALTAILEWAGLRQVQTMDYPLLREQQIDRLAQCVTEHLDMPRLQQIIQDWYTNKAS